MILKILVLLLFTSSAFAAEYLEVGTTYRVYENGQKAFHMNWNPEIQSMIVTLGLVVLDPQELGKQEGYDLSQALSFRIAFPSETEECQLMSVGGQISKNNQSNDNRVILKYKGAACEDLHDAFRVNGMTTVVFYNVPSLSGQGERAVNLRVRVWDYAP